MPGNNAVNTSATRSGDHQQPMWSNFDAPRGADVDAICDACETPLSLAVSIGRPDTVKILLELGASVRVEGQLETLLHKAVRSGSITVVQATRLE